MDQNKKNIRILLLLFVGVLMGALDLSIVGPIIPAIEKSMLIHGHNLSWIFSIYLLFYLFGLPLMSKLSDIYGRKSIYIISLAIFGFGSLLVFLSRDFTLLLIGRAFQGFGSCGVFPVAAATIGDVFPIEKRGRALGILGAVYGIAFILGPIIAGTMLHYFNWNAIFLINIPIVFLLIFFAVKLLPGKPAGDKSTINWVGIILIIISLSCFSLAINNIDVTNIAGSLVSISVFPFLISVLIFTPILVMHERKQENSFLNMAFFKSKQLRLVGIISFGLGLFQSSIIFIPKLAVGIFNISPSKASFMLLPLVLATAIVPPISGRLLEIIGSRIIIFTGLVFAVVSLILFSTLSNNLTVFYLAETAFGIGLAIRASIKYIILNEINPNKRAASIGMLMILISIGQLTGAALIGTVISGNAGELKGFSYSFISLSAITILLVIISLFLKNRMKENLGLKP